MHPVAGGLVHLEVGTFRISLITDSLFPWSKKVLFERKEWGINFSSVGIKKKLWSSRFKGSEYELTREMCRISGQHSGLLQLDSEFKFRWNNKHKVVGFNQVVDNGGRRWGGRELRTAQGTDYSYRARDWNQVWKEKRTPGGEKPWKNRRGGLRSPRVPKG